MGMGKLEELRQKSQKEEIRNQEDDRIALF